MKLTFKNSSVMNEIKNLWYKEIEGIRNKKMIKVYSQGCDMRLNESNYICFL